MSDRQSGGGSSRDSAREPRESPAWEAGWVVRRQARAGRPRESGRPSLSPGRPSSGKPGGPPGGGRSGSAAALRVIGRSSRVRSGWFLQPCRRRSGSAAGSGPWVGTGPRHGIEPLGRIGRRAALPGPGIRGRHVRSRRIRGLHVRPRRVRGRHVRSRRTRGPRVRPRRVRGRHVRSRRSRGPRRPPPRVRGRTSGVVGVAVLPSGPRSARPESSDSRSSRPPTSGSRSSRPPTSGPQAVEARSDGSWTGHARRPGSADPRGRPGRRPGPGHAELAAHAARRPGRDRRAAPRGGRPRAAR